jgi:hypothetical protein
MGPNTVEKVGTKLKIAVLYTQTITGAEVSSVAEG